MYYDSVEQLVALAGIHDNHDTGETHLDDINPRKMATLTENIRRAETDSDSLNMIYNWVQAGRIDTLQFKNLLQTHAEREDED